MSQKYHTITVPNSEAVRRYLVEAQKLEHTQLMGLPGDAEKIHADTMAVAAFARQRAQEIQDTPDEQIEIPMRYDAPRDLIKLRCDLEGIPEE